MPWFFLALKCPRSDSQPLPVPCVTILKGLWHPSGLCSPLPVGCGSPAWGGWHPPVGWGGQGLAREGDEGVPGRAMKVSQGGLRCSGGFVQLTRGKGRARGKRGKEMWSAWKWWTGPVPPCATRPLTDVLRLGMGRSLFGCRGETLPKD